MGEMTLSTPRLEKTVSDVDTNMMGIKSFNLYEFLKKIIEEGDLSVLEKSKPDELIPDLVYHMTVTIPDEILRNYDQHNENRFRIFKDNLYKFGEYLLKTFSSQHKYPFTIVRICELCYDPLKYYRIHELEKFVSAIGKCCMVRSPWEFCDESDGFFTDLGIDNNNDDQSEDVSLTKIPWIDAEAEKELGPFLKEIDGLMSAHFGFEDDEDDEDMDVDINDSANRNGDFIIEEYYEDIPEKIGDSSKDDDGDEDDEDDEDYDDDYVETPTSDDNEQWNDDDFEEQKYRSLDGYENDEQTRDYESKDKKVNPSEQNEQIEKVHEATPSKRKPTELDDFEYKEPSNIVESHSLTTPKKLKQDRGSIILESPDVTSSENDYNTTPLHSQEIIPERISDKESNSPSSDGHHVPILVSPRNNYDEEHISQEGKMRELMDRSYDGDVGSPLGNKSR